MLSEIDDEAPRSSSLGSVEFVFSDHDVVHLLKAAIEREGSQSAFAKRHGVDRPTLNAILKGRRSVSTVLKALQLRKVYVVSSDGGCEAKANSWTHNSVLDTTTGSTHYASSLTKV